MLQKGGPRHGGPDDSPLRQATAMLEALEVARAAIAKARGEGWEHDDDCWAADITRARPWR